MVSNSACSQVQSQETALRQSSLDVASPYLFLAVRSNPLLWFLILRCTACSHWLPNIIGFGPIPYKVQWSDQFWPYKIQNFLLKHPETGNHLSFSSPNCKSFPDIGFLLGSRHKEGASQGLCGVAFSSSLRSNHPMKPLTSDGSYKSNICVWHQVPDSWQLDTLQAMALSSPPLWFPTFSFLTVEQATPSKAAWHHHVWGLHRVRGLPLQNNV